MIKRIFAKLEHRVMILCFVMHDNKGEEGFALWSGSAP